MALTGVDRLARIWTPAAEAMRPARTIEAEKRLDRAIGGDGYIRADALPPAAQPYPLTWSIVGTVSTGQYGPRYVTRVAYELRELIAGISTPPTGQSMLLHIEDVNNEEFASLEIPVSANFAYSEPLNVFIDPGTWIRAQVDQVGSGTAGSDLSIHAVLYPVEG